MKNVLLAAASAVALMLSTPSFAAHDHHGGGHGDSTGGHHDNAGGGGGHHRDNGGGGRHDNNPFGGTNPFGGNNPFGGAHDGGHGGSHGHHGNGWNGHNNGWDIFRHILRSPHQYHHGYYRRPYGWYYRNWVLGDILPSLFWAQEYRLSDYYDYGLEAPPPGCVWVRYGDDALLIDRDTGEIIQVVRGVFY